MNRFNNRLNYFFLNWMMFGVMAFGVSSAHAGDFEWSGLYRIEGYSIKNSELNSYERDKSYGLHHLVLRPKIVAADGLTIYGRFDLLNASGSYPNSQLGQIFGNGVSSSPLGTTSNERDSNTLSQTQKSENLEVTQMYLTYVQEFGALIAGRAPLHFGLGMLHNAGEGLFDHWMDTRDMIGYKIQLGNIFVFPMFAKSSEGTALHKNDDVSEIMLHAQYENPETGLEMGLFFQERKANDQANDAPQGTDTGELIGGTTGVRSNKFSLQNTNIYVLKDTEKFRFGLEAGFQSGKSGISTSAATGDNVQFSGFSVVTEFEWRFRSWDWGFNAGVVSGDDPETDDKFEGYLLDRNYDLAFLMFNHPMGRADFLRTSLGGGGPTSSQDGNNTVDTEMISNVNFFRTHLNHKWSDRWSINMAVITGWVNQQPILGSDTGSNLGMEFDFSVNFSPNKKIVWTNGFGVFSPGEIFEACASQTKDCGSELSYGLMSKAAVSF